jgi:hypothetical protein
MRSAAAAAQAILNGLARRAGVAGGMDATPISLDSAIPLGALPFAGGLGGGDPIADKWAALHNAAFVLATLAGVPDAPIAAQHGRFSASIRNAAGWRRDMAAQALDDLVAIMEPGLTALLVVHSRGDNAGAAARALWQEFVAARDALMALALPLD